MLDCYKDYIEEKGVSLRDIGLQEKAFTRNDAMEAIRRRRIF
jgi:hypothetical protein